MTFERSDVSRETLERLETYLDLLQRWSKKINLVSKSSIQDPWDRHIWDSAQIMSLTATPDGWLDLGSGGGLPGLIVSILAREFKPDMTVTLIESDIRKSTFLRTVIRELELNADVIVSRIEEVAPFNAPVVSARALAELTQLLSFVQTHIHPTGCALLMKGAAWEKEVEVARESWSFDLVAHKSKTNADSAILEVRDIKRV